MYESHFGLRELPFTLTPNTRFYLNAGTHQQALQVLLVALKNLEGFIKIVGEVGTGKTLLCRKLLNSLSAPYVTAYIPNPQLPPADLYRAVAEELKLVLEPDAGTHQILKQINQNLIEHAREGRQVVLVIDEAQVMPEASIEALRLLTNLETESRKLLQIVLFGQPELDQLLARDTLRQLRQRITFQEYLKPLDRQAVGHYLQHRLAMAGYNGGQLFQPRAVKLLHQASGGIPRLVNVLAHKSLIAAYGAGDREIRPGHVKRAAADTESVRPLGWSWLSWGGRA